MTNRSTRIIQKFKARQRRRSSGYQKPSVISQSKEFAKRMLGSITIEDVRNTNIRMINKTNISKVTIKDKYSKMGNEVLERIRKKITRDSINAAYKAITKKSGQSASG